MSRHELTLGDFSFTHGEGDGWRADTMAADSSFGATAPVLTSVQSLMRDGAISAIDRFENRTASFVVEIKGSDLAAVAEGEAALMAELGRSNTLTWTPPDGFGVPTAFDVVTSWLAEFRFDNFDELLLRRRFAITLECLPFARSVEPTVIGSEFVSDTVAISDDCESTTGWATTAAYPGGTFSIDSTAGNFATGTGSVKLTYPGTKTASGGIVNDITRVVKSGLSIDASGGGYLSIAVKPDWTMSTASSNVQAVITTTGGGAESVDTLVAAMMDANGFLRLSWPVPDASTVTALEFTIQQSRNANDGSEFPRPAVRFDSIGLAAASSAGQQTRTLLIEGSARTEGDIAISAPAGLGDVLLYTVPDLGDGFRPDVRRWQASGTTATDAAAVNGTNVILSSAPTFDMPAKTLRPGAYAVFARIKTPTPGAFTVSVSAQLRQGGVAVGPVEAVSSPNDTLPSTGYHVRRVGVMYLPPSKVSAESSAMVRFTVSRSGAETYLDELLVLPMEDAAVTWAECGTGSGSATVFSRLWVDAPSRTYPRGQIVAGNAADRSDARVIRPLARGSHLLVPGQVFAYLLASAAGGADMAVTYFKRWQSNAGS